MSLPEDVSVVVGDEATEYQAIIIEGVSKELGDDQERLQEFVRQTRDYGRGSTTSADFWTYLLSAFGHEKAVIFLPKLARLIPDGEARRGLLRQPSVEHEDRSGMLPSVTARGENTTDAAVEKLGDMQFDGDVSDKMIRVEEERAIGGGGGGDGDGSSTPPGAAKSRVDGENPFGGFEGTEFPLSGDRSGAEEDNPFAAEQRHGVSFDEGDLNPFGDQSIGAAGTASSSTLAASQQLSTEALQVKEMFPDLPGLAIEAALESASLASVIDKALAGQVDVHAMPRAETSVGAGGGGGFASAEASTAGEGGGGSGGGGRHLSGRTIRVLDAQSKFPSECLPPTMLPRDLARMQDLFPTVPTSLLQAELQCVGSVHAAMNVLLNGTVHVEVLRLDPVPIALRGYLVKSDPQGKNFTRRFFILRQLTGSLCYAKLPEDMDDPLGVIYLFKSRLSDAPLDGKQAVQRKFGPSIDHQNGFSLVTPNRTYQLYSESAEETAAWKTVLTQMTMLMVPDEFMAGSDEVECEVFENEIYTLLTGWGPGSWASRLTYSDRKGELSSAEFPEVRLPSDFKWMDDWHLDKTYAACDKDGWSYAGTFAGLEQDLERGESSGVNRTFDMVRRRRWVRNSRRFQKAAEMTDDEVDPTRLMDFGGGQGSRGVASTSNDVGSPSMTGIPLQSLTGRGRDSRDSEI